MNPRAIEDIRAGFEKMKHAFLAAFAVEADAQADESDSVNRPSHYTQHPSGVECITITEHMGFNLGNAVKYIWRADLKNDAIEDLKKADWYIRREIERRERSE
ncbi:DUF3310 domain-containing protein [Pandoraea sp. SD6-2]|uniref:DUF3310 domain-containing protein n=1 Tax=Pandoraea sp. SD6-2 TaxID=1286093 RepID=UPI00032F3F1E|nr:DUF3310 domain-containing protein [Pandoraea sp. SD6-2]EON13418.1 hypothetical protein C266_11195 [Pandoraea sp. SD6-2]